MKAKNILLVAGLSMALSAAAAPLTPQQALERARSNGPARMAAKIPASAKPVYSAKSESGVTGAYVFNNSGAGYVILAADDVAYPVLGYSDSGSIDVNNMSPELKWWLGEYARQIEWAVANGAGEALRAPGYSTTEREAIPALMTTKWNQDAPYYNDCPKTKDGLQCYTGCVATSMAQVMNYHRYPVHGEGIKQYQCASIGRRLTINFAQKDFDWANMLNIYDPGSYNDDQAAAVAYLMKCCGYAVEMGYGPDSSGASGSIIASALRQYFNYDDGCRTLYRMVYSGSQWEEMIYNNLKSVGPVIINGQSPLQGGHSFVCDGYDGKGYFHFNWGWGGVSDGFYSLDALNPDAQGIGGATGGFNFMQNGIFGMQPPTGKPADVEPVKLLQYGTTIASISNRVVTFNVEDYNPLGWGCISDDGISAYIGAIVEPIDGTPGNAQEIKGALGSMDVVSLSGNGGYYPNTRVQPVVSLPELADGKYRVTLASKLTDVENAQWLPVEVPWGCKNYFLLTVSGSSYTVTNVPMASVKMTDIQFKSAVYAGKNALLNAKFVNNSELELVQGLAPRLFNSAGKAQFTGESILVTLAPGQTLEKEWAVKFYNSDGTNATVSKATDFTMKFYDPNTGLYIDGVEVSVTMQPSPGTTKLMLTGFNITNATSVQEMTVDGMYVPRVSMIADAADIQTTMSFKVTSGFFDGAVYFGITKQNPEYPSGTIPVVDQIYQTMPFLAKNETFSADIPLNFKDAKPGVLYFIVANYTNGSRIESFGRLAFMVGGSGIADIDLADDAPETYYNLMGMEIKNPLPGQLVIVRQGAKSYKRIWK